VQITIFGTEAWVGGEKKSFSSAEELKEFLVFHYCCQTLKELHKEVLSQQQKAILNPFTLTLPVTFSDCQL
jgi:hypothetical protein